MSRMSRRPTASTLAQPPLALAPGLVAAVLALAGFSFAAVVMATGAASLVAALAIWTINRRDYLYTHPADDRIPRDPRSLFRTPPLPSSEAVAPLASVQTGQSSAPGDSRFLRAVIDSIQDIVLLFDAAGGIRFFNKAAEDFFGGASRPIFDRAIEDLFVQTEVLEMHRAAARGESSREEIQITGRQGRRTFQTLATPIGEPSGASVLLLLRDTTDIQSALRLGGDFVASVSHEMRTPLASIKGALETLRDSASDDPSMTERLHQMIATNVDRLEALTADVLRLSQLESAGTPPEIAIVETKPVFDSISSLLEPLLSERGLRIELDVPPELASVRTDARLFELILKNLLENAGKFAFENSVLKVVGRAGAKSTTWQVIDRGIGIPLNQQSRIFDRFYQVDTARTGSPKRRGTGLGLAIVQNAVKALGGSIRVDSVWQQGTTMTVELPDSPQREISSPSHPSSSATAQS